MGKTRARKPILFLVVRIGWRGRYTSGFDWFRDDKGKPRKTGRPVAAYTGREDAEARRAALEAEARACLNPFAFFEDYWLDDYSSLPLCEFERRLRKALPGARLP